MKQFNSVNVTVTNQIELSATQLAAELGIPLDAEVWYEDMDGDPVFVDIANPIFIKWVPKEANETKS